MKLDKVWEILGIEETKDSDLIVEAYRSRVVNVNPEDDPEGFKQLREAFETAMNYSESDEAEQQKSIDDVDPQFQPFVSKAIEIYDDIEKRADLDCWKDLFDDPLCNELDTADQAREEFLKVLLDRFYIPHSVYKYADNIFMIKNEAASLKERFPENFIDYILFHIDNDDFIEYSKVISRDYYNDYLKEQGIIMPELPAREVSYDEPDYISPYDNYFRAVSSLVPDIEETVTFQNTPELQGDAPEEIKKFNDDMYGILRYVKKCSIFHPVELSGTIRLLGFLGEKEKAKYLAEQVITGKTAEIEDVYVRATACYYLLKELKEEENGRAYQYLPDIKKIIDEILEERPKYNICIRAKIFYYCIMEDYEKANDTLMRLFEIDANNADAIVLLPYVNDKLVEYYDKKIEEEPGVAKHVIDKCWGLFRCDRVDEALEIITKLDIPEPFTTEYSDYYNLIGRSYSKKDDFKNALPYLEKWREALEFFETKKKKDPNSISEEEDKKLKRMAYCHYLCGMAYQKNGDMDKAVEYVRYAIENEPDKVDIPYYMESLGMILHDNGDYQAAMDVWNEMIEQNKYYISAYVRRQATAFEMRDAQLVIDDYYIIQQQAPNYIKNYFYAAKVYYIYDQYNNVDEVIARAQAENIDSESLMLIETDMLLDKGNQEAAGELLRVLRERLDKGETDLEKFDTLKDYYLTYGRYLSMTGESPENCYREGLEKCPESAGINFSLGVLLYDNEKYKEAAKYLEKTLEINPRHRAANNKLSRVYDDLYYDTENPEYYKKAVMYADKQMEIDDDGYYCVERALLLNKGAEYEKSVEDSTKAIEQDETNYYAYNARGVSYMMLKEYEKAEESFKLGLKHMEGASEEDSIPNLYHNLAKCYEMQFKYPESVDVLKEILRKFGENRTVHYRLALALKKAKRFDEAVSEYMTVARMNMDAYNDKKSDWSLDNLFDCYTAVYNTRLYEHNRSAMDTISKYMLKKFIDDHKLMALGGNINSAIKDNFVAACILEKYSSTILYSFRDYKKALKTAERALSYLGSYKFIKHRGQLTTYMDISSTIMVSAAYLGKTERARDAAIEIQECMKKISGDKMDDYLAYTENSTYRRKEYALVSYFLGRREEAMKTLEELVEAPRCRMCRHAKCYESYLMMAKIFEFENDIQSALEYYKKAAETGAEDSEVVSALNLLTGGKN